MSGGWFLRNRWGLVAIVPVFLAAIAVDLPDAYHRFWKSQPRWPIEPGSDGWVSFAGGRVRLAELAPANDLRQRDGRLFVPPPGVGVWRAEIVFDAGSRDVFSACRLLLEDQSGRTFDAGPGELRGLRLPTAGCTAPATPPPASGRTTFQTFAFFVMPASARPAAVRLVLLNQLPAYARL